MLRHNIPRIIINKRDELKLRYTSSGSLYFHSQREFIESFSLLPLAVGTSVSASEQKRIKNSSEKPLSLSKPRSSRHLIPAVIVFCIDTTHPIYNEKFGEQQVDASGVR
jgi:hypothetical protein